MMRALIILVLLLAVAFPASAAEKGVEALLPPSCAPGWVMEGKVATYTPETLYKYINGEAELYVPYGFRKAATVMYVKPGSKDAGIVANIFEMGSLLDAFGIYGNFRSPTLDQIKTGAEGFLDESQLMYYQDRYFVQIEASGTLAQGGPLFQACADAISRNLPASKERPRELDILKIPGAVPLTEKYYATGLLGYSFFGKGLTGEVVVGEVRAKVLVILGSSEEAARRVFAQYPEYLKKAGVTAVISSDTAGTVLRATDPLYKGVLLHQSGRYVVGVVGLKESGEGDGIVGQLLQHLPKNQ
jgi:hypothetical protein